jgi:hypothetical protein
MKKLFFAGDKSFFFEPRTKIFIISFFGQKYVCAKIHIMKFFAGGKSITNTKSKNIFLRENSIFTE